MDSWGSSACYPRRTFYPLSDGPPTRDHRITMTDFRLCSTCLSRSQAGLCHCTRRTISDRLREGKLPYCVSACPNGVYYFGDEYEDAVTNGTTKETVKLSTLLHDNAAYQLLPELGTKPRVYYLPPTNRVFPFVPSKDAEPKKS